jgi:peptidoglycan/xylan/chitin deacetylase (PgdA/CDA1 family)
MVSDDEVLHIKHLYSHKSVKEFSDDIDFILKYFLPISLNDIFNHLSMRKPLPPKALHMTFDDGFREAHDIVAPILIKKGIPATFFINSSFTDNNALCYQHKASLIVEHLLHHNISKTAQGKIEHLLGPSAVKTTATNFHILAIKYDQRNLIDRIAEILDMDFNDYLQGYHPYLTTQQIHQLITGGFTIGAHSIDHPLYAKLTLEEQISQTMESVRFVRNTFNLDYGAFAFPHSDLGVSKQYFNLIENSGLVDISFGTSGMIEDCIQNHYQRFSLENPLLPAQKIFAYQYAKRLWRYIKHSNKIIRKQIKHTN